MDEPAKNSIWNYLIPLWHLEQVSSIFGRRGVEVSLTSHYGIVDECGQYSASRLVEITHHQSP